MTESTRGLESLRRQLADLPRLARGAGLAALHQVASEAADAVRAALPAEDASAVTVDDDPAGASLTIDLPEAAALEFGTARIPARPLLRPLAMEAGGRAPGLIAAAVRVALRGPAS